MAFIVICFNNEPCAVFSGGNFNFLFFKSYAAIMPAINPIADDSTYPSTPVICPARLILGYDFNWNQYFYKISNFDLSNMDQSIIEKFKIPVGKAQIEAVKIIDESSFWITSEDEGNGFPRLFKFKIM